jgi:hypothetical protein
LALFADGDTLVIDLRIVRRKQLARAIIDRAGRLGFLLRTRANDQGDGEQKPDASHASMIEQPHHDRLSPTSYFSGKNRLVDKPPGEARTEAFAPSAAQRSKTLSRYLELVA